MSASAICQIGAAGAKGIGIDSSDERDRRSQTAATELRQYSGSRSAGPRSGSGLVRSWCMWPERLSRTFRNGRTAGWGVAAVGGVGGGGGAGGADSSGACWSLERFFWLRDNLSRKLGGALVWSGDGVGLVTCILLQEL